MKFIMMCGMPFSGKTEVSKIIYKNTKSRLLISPEEWMPANLESLQSGEEMAFRTVCWETAIQKTEMALREDIELVVLNQCNAKHLHVSQLLSSAKDSGREAITLYVRCPVDICAKRAGDRWIGDQIASRYIDDFLIALPIYKKKSDLLLVIDNTCELGDLESVVNRKCQNAKIY